MGMLVQQTHVIYLLPILFPQVIWLGIPPC